MRRISAGNERLRMTRDWTRAAACLPLVLLGTSSTRPNLCGLVLAELSILMRFKLRLCDI